jgi:Rrf2 family nitric oxide-sensitive transcriptional repressor
MFAGIRGDELSKAQEIAEAYGISRAHTVKCVHQLGQWGYLENFRGRNGGFRLAKKPENITVGEIARLTEDGFDIVECFNAETNTCRIAPACLLGLTFRKALDAFLEVLDSNTVADLVSRPDELAPLMMPQKPASNDKAKVPAW